MAQCCDKLGQQHFSPHQDTCRREETAKPSYMRCFRENPRRFLLRQSGRHLTTFVPVLHTARLCTPNRIHPDYAPRHS